MTPRKFPLLKKSLFRFILFSTILFIIITTLISSSFNSRQVPLIYSLSFCKNESKSLPFSIPESYLLIPYREFALRTSIACRVFKFDNPTKNLSSLHPKYSKYLNGTFPYVIPSQNITFDDIEKFYTDLSSLNYRKEAFVPRHTSFATNLTFANVPYIYKNGMWEPIEVQSYQRSAILVPLQGRHYNAKAFLLNLHAYFRRQLLTYAIFIIEQTYPMNKFNKGRLYNTAFNYIRQNKSLNITCYILHDVDLIPEHDSNYYSCETMNPKHTTSRVRQLIRGNYVKYYEFLIGGVLILTYNHYEELNGFSNLYWGWGGEDDDLALRFVQQKMCVIRPPFAVAIYTALPHPKGQRNNQRFGLLLWSTIRLKTDGLHNIETLTRIVEVKRWTTFTHLKVNVDITNSKDTSLSTSKVTTTTAKLTPTTKKK
ncbi:unnamed protein product [Didymodactylos carnosus]|uniref:Beta-1,4-galactosyltransferase n=1 Tax=Didymodactylos carnosus TaxID=1234261 RepID=A0A8S2HBD1_9BILA|nr:unnamed protein product [Didymodactylos carnosus]CAF3624865.1 unnamed protein product [Didymodactylos carnosus]